MNLGTKIPKLLRIKQDPIQIDAPKRTDQTSSVVNLSLFPYAENAKNRSQLRKHPLKKQATIPSDFEFQEFETASQKQAELEQLKREQSLPQGFWVDQTIHEVEYEDNLASPVPPKPMILAQPDQQTKEPAQQQNTLDKLFDASATHKKTIKKEKDMVFAMNHELKKVDERVMGLNDVVTSTQKQLPQIEEAVTEIQQEALLMVLMSKLDMADDELNNAIRGQIQKETKIEPYMELPEMNQKLDLLYQDNQDLIIDYDNLREEVEYQMELMKFTEDELKRLEAEKLRREKSSKMKLRIEDRINGLQDDKKKQLYKNKFNTLQVKEEIRESKKGIIKSGFIPIKQEKQVRTTRPVQLTIGYGKNKPSFRGLEI